MINSLIKHENKNNNKAVVNDLLNDIYLLPKWEKIKSFSISNKFLSLFHHKSLNLDLFRKFSSKNQLEKYSIRAANEKVLASMDLRIYKDSVYIINFDINSKIYFEPVSEKMLQVAVEKALYNTTEKEVVINLSSDLLTNHKIKKCLLNNEFVPEEAQSDYEKDMFGETLTLKISNSSIWMKRIKQFQFLINK